ncbi:MAG: SpoIVB peptidase [Clostridiales bacterium]|jgi:stage IV sporulation protein B|nr:SpoIVB peptidase [Clostridiales bacterium]
MKKKNFGVILLALFAAAALIVSVNGGTERLKISAADLLGNAESETAFNLEKTENKGAVRLSVISDKTSLYSGDTGDKESSPLFGGRAFAAVPKFARERPFDIKKISGGIKKFIGGFKERGRGSAGSKNEISYEDVYIGGLPIGISLNTDGLIITGKNDVITKTGVVSPAARSNIMSGDILMFINDARISKPDDISAALKKNKGEEVVLKLRRGKIEFSERVAPAEDSLTGARRLGLIVKTDLMGIGTLTFVKNDMRYGALGHQITDAETGLKDLNDGDIYECTIIGIIKGERNRAGELRGLIDKNGGSLGTIDKNNHFGIFGTAANRLTENLEKISVGSKYAVKPGRAYIRTTVAGETSQLYEIEIIKTNFQGDKSEKGMIIRVTDENLLKITGGILQGMSGSPIIQDGKLVGAVTHVFINDPSKGYGMYIDWMLNE